MWILNTNICSEQNNDVVPQVAHMGPGYQWDAPDSISRIDSNAPLGFAPNLRSFHLDPDTYLTDVVSHSFVYTAGLLVSHRFYGALDGLVVQPHESYPAEVVHRGETYRFVWMHVTELIESRIDFAESRFLISPFGRQAEPIVFADADELSRKARELVNTIGPVRLVPERLVFLQGTPRYDLFALLLTEWRFFASDLLADRLRTEGLTGFGLDPAPCPITFP
jgi:hypothetical protein